MYSEPRMFLDSVIYFLPKQLNPGIFVVGRNYIEIPWYTRISMGFLSYSNLA